MINVAMLTPFFTGELGGPYNVISEIIPYLEARGASTTIFTTSAIAKYGNKRTEFYEHKSKNFRTYRLDSFLKFREYRVSFSLLPLLIKHEKEIDLIHSHALRSYQEDMGSIFSLLKKKPMVISPHGGITINWDYSDKIPKMIYDKTLGYIKRKLIKPYFIAVAKSEIPMIKQYGIDDDHIFYIPHGVNTEIFKPTYSDDLKRKYDLEGYDVILYVGRIAKGKGLNILIKILNNLIQKKKNVKLLIVGGDSGYLSIVLSLIKKYNLSKYVIMPGFISKKELPKYYSMADLVVYPSRQEIFGLVILEAMACEKAVIGSDIMGPREIIVNGETGYTSNFEDLNEVSEMILNLLNDRKLLTEMGKNAIKRIKQVYSWKRSAESYFKLYKDILSQKI